MLVVHPLTGEADYAVIEPTEMAYSIDVNATIVDITWSSWTATGATGQGSRVRDDCDPDCASGTITWVPTTITLADPVSGQFTRPPETFDGQTQTLTGTGLIEGAGANPAKLPVPTAATRCRQPRQQPVAGSDSAFCRGGCGRSPWGASSSPVVQPFVERVIRVTDICSIISITTDGY